MKTIYLILVVAVLAFGSYVEAGPLVPNKTVDISLDGFCDGMHLVINETTGLVTGNATGCGSGTLVGTVGSLSKLGAGITVMSYGLLYVIDDNPRKWTNYNSDGTLLFSGTYSIGVPALAVQWGAKASSNP